MSERDLTTAERLQHQAVIQKCAIEFAAMAHMAKQIFDGSRPQDSRESTAFAEHMVAEVTRDAFNALIQEPRAASVAHLMVIGVCTRILTMNGCVVTK